MLYVITILLTIILIKLFIMANELDAIKADVVSAKQKVEKVAADVAALHEKLDAIGEVPTEEQWAEVKAMTAELNTSLQAVDDATADA
jgi:hypothetical protein